MKKIIIIASVKNECDIIESFCRYNLTFCDAMLIYEGRKSSDKTRDIIKKLIDEKLPVFFEAEENDIYYETVKGILTDTAIKKYKADLVIQLDADEFLCHTGGINPRETLETLDEEVEYQIPWRTYVYEKDPDDNSIFVPDNFTHYRNPALEEAQGHAGKTLASRYLLAVKQARFEHGGHWLVYPDEYKDEAKIELSKELFCAHYPIRSKNQIMNKTVPNWINKWTQPELQRPSRSLLSVFQLGLLFDDIKEHGAISSETMKEVSLTYSLHMIGDKERIHKLVYGLGDELTIEKSIDTSFCKDKLTLKYSGNTYGNSIFLQATLQALDKAIDNLDSESREKTQKLRAITGELESLKEQHNDTARQLSDLTRHHYELSQQHNVLVVRLNELLVEHNNLLHHHKIISEQCDNQAGQLANIYRSFSWKIGNGIVRTLRFFIPRRKKKAEIVNDDMSSLPMHDMWFVSADVKDKQRAHIFGKDIKFSILVPLYNTPEGYLLNMIDSVVCQTYLNWELCLADCSDRKNKHVRKICKDLVKQYGEKIKYKKLRKNLGIAENTNECIKMAAGDYYALLDHDDALHPSALFRCMRAICEDNADFIYSDECKFIHYQKDAFDMNYKPDFAPDTFRGCNYICHLSVFSKALTDKAGAFRAGFDGSQDYDLFLRLTEQAQNIVHIPEVLYFWRVHSDSAAASTAAKTYAYTSGINAIGDHLKRVGFRGSVTSAFDGGFYHVCYELKEQPLISVIIPNADNTDVLDKCLKSIFEKTTYKNFEVLVIENNSKDPETFEYYKSLESNDKIKLLTLNEPFNFSRINNYAAGKTYGDYIVLLNNDTEVITGNWLEEMLMFAQRDDVGAVGAMLYYPDDTVQHAGVILGIGGVAGHAHLGFKRGDGGYFGRMLIAQNLSCITAACMMISKTVYQKIGGMNEDFAVAFNDIDLCMRIRKAGYLIVWTPFAELYHHESKTRGYEDTPEKQERFKGEVLLFQDLWSKELEAGDPYYNCNLTIERLDFSERAKDETAVIS